MGWARSTTPSEQPPRISLQSKALLPSFRIGLHLQAGSDLISNYEADGLPPGEYR